jgi:hypothetical protein
LTTCCAALIRIVFSPSPLMMKSFIVAELDPLLQRGISVCLVANIQRNMRIGHDLLRPDVQDVAPNRVIPPFLTYAPQNWQWGAAWGTQTWNIRSKIW